MIGHLLHHGIGAAGVALLALVALARLAWKAMKAVVAIAVGYLLIVELFRGLT